MDPPSKPCPSTFVASNRPAVLVVDDEPVTAKGYASALLDRGFRVSAASDAETALGIAQAEIGSLLAQLQAAHDNARSLQKLLGSKDAELASAMKRAANKEENAEKAVADLHNIADGIRREFPPASG